jgi:hypothetical protein
MVGWIIVIFFSAHRQQKRVLGSEHDGEASEHERAGSEEHADLDP